MTDKDFIVTEDCLGHSEIQERYVTKGNKTLFQTKTIRYDYYGNIKNETPWETNAIAYLE